VNFLAKIRFLGVRIAFSNFDNAICPSIFLISAKLFTIKYGGSTISRKKAKYYIYICTVTLPSRRAFIHPENLNGARAERPRQKKIARAVSKSPERRAIIIFRAINNLFYCIIFTSGNPPEGNRKRPTKDSFCDNRHMALTDFEPRAEVAPEDQDSAESRVDFAPAIEGGKATKKQLSWTEITGPDRRHPPRTEDERSASRRPQIAGSPKFRISNYRGRYGPDTALSRGAVIPRVSRRYWPRIRAPPRAGLTPLSILDREIQGFFLVRTLGMISRSIRSCIVVVTFVAIRSRG